MLDSDFPNAMMRRFFRYLFPPLRNQQKLPLLTRNYSSVYSRYGEPPPEALPLIDILLMHGLAQTQADAYRLLRQYKNVSITEIVRIEKRKRRREPRWKRALRRLKVFLVG